MDSGATTLIGFTDVHTACKPSCLTRRCRNGDCTLTLPRDRTICIDCDACSSFRRGPGEKKPDFVILHAQTDPVKRWWIVVEMKSRLSSADDIVRQLQAGADIIQNDSNFRFRDSPSRLIPIIVHGRGAHTAEVTTLRRRRVSFAGKPWPILSKHCGANLESLLE